MSIEAGLYAFITADPTFQALASDRLYRLRMPPDPTWPNVVYFRVSGPRDRTVEGANGIARPRFQFDCRAETAAEADALAAVVRRRIEDYRGMMGAVRVRNVAVIDQGDDYDPESSVYRVILDAIITHEE